MAKESAHSLLAVVDLVLGKLIEHPELQQGDKATCVLLRLSASNMLGKYTPTAPRVPLSTQFAMAAGAPEAEQLTLLGGEGR